MYEQFLVLFGLIITGYICRRFDIIDEQMNRGLNRFILYLAFPCLIIHKIGNLEMNSALMWNFFLTLAISVGAFIIYGVYAYFYAKIRKFPKENSNIAEFAMATPNNAFMGFPISLMFFGEKGLFLMLANNTAMNLFLFSYGVYLMGRNDTKKAPKTFKAILNSTKKLLFNPNILALAIGFAVCLLHIPIPQSVNTYLLYLGNTTTPMAMILIGSTLTNSRLLEVIKNRVVLECSLNKLIILPMITYGIVAFLPIASQMKAIVILGCLFPSAAMVSMLAREHGQDTQLSTEILFLSTMLSAITLPIGIQLINTFII